jgi:phosphonate transport system substrate-binding protein
MKPVWMIFIVFILAACGQHEAGKAAGPQYSRRAPEVAKEYVFAIHPLHNPARLFEIYGPLIDYLNRNVSGARFRLEAARNYEELKRNCMRGKSILRCPTPIRRSIRLIMATMSSPRWATMTNLPA